MTAPTWYLDRRSAGRRLAEALQHLRGRDPVVIGLPRGGVPVADEVARVLGAPLDILVARKVGAPGNPEFGIGAVAPGVVHIDPAAEALGVTQEYLDRVVAREQAEARRREEAYREGRPPVELAGRTVVLVDDGLATGATAVAAIRSLRQRAPRAVVLAVPVGAAETVAALRRLADEVVCPLVPPEFRAVGEFYVDFSPTSDHEVREALKRSRSPTH
jgi:predicted phosphoribosyltransferase